MARPIAKDYDSKRDHILNVAARVFSEEGYDRASVSKVAAACAISKANIYHYYASKDELLFAILDTHLRDLRDRVAVPEMSDMTPAEQLQATVTGVLMAYQGADHTHRLQAQGLDLLPSAQQDVLRGYQRDMVNVLSRQIAACAPQVFDDDKAKLRATTMSVFGMLNWFYMWNQDADAQARQDYAKLVCRLTLSGVQAL